MKKIVLITALFITLPIMAFAATTSKGNYNKPGSSYHTTAIREHVHEYVDTDTHRDSEKENYEKFDYGTFLDLILFESKDKNYKIINKNDWEVERNEFTTKVGVQINVWSIFKDKE